MPEAAPSRASRAGRLLRTSAALLLGLAASVLFGALAFGSFQRDAEGWHFVPRISLDTVQAALAQLSWSSVALVVLITMASLPLRAIQWGELVAPQGRFRDRYHATAVGFMAINTLPMSLGEVVRGVMLSLSVPALPRSTSVGSVLCSRMFDIFALWLLSAPLPWLLQVPQESKGFLNGGFVALTLLAWGAALLVWIAQRQANAVSDWVVRVFGPRVGTALARFVTGFGPKLSAGALGRALAWTVLFQFVTAAAYIPVIRELCPTIAPVSAAIYGLAAISVGLAVPSTPSGAGVYHFAMATALQTVGATPAQAVATALVLHLGALTGFVLAGLLSLIVTGTGAFRASLRTDSAT